MASKTTAPGNNRSANCTCNPTINEACWGLNLQISPVIDEINPYSNLYGNLTLSGLTSEMITDVTLLRVIIDGAPKGILEWFNDAIFPLVFQAHIVTTVADAIFQDPGFMLLRLSAGTQSASDTISTSDTTGLSGSTLVDLHWFVSGAAKVRTGCVVGTVTGGTSFTFSGGTGDALPGGGEVDWILNSDGGVSTTTDVELDFDWTAYFGVTLASPWQSDFKCSAIIKLLDDGSGPIFSANWFLPSASTTPSGWGCFYGDPHVLDSTVLDESTSTGATCAATMRNSQWVYDDPTDGAVGVWRLNLQNWTDGTTNFDFATGTLGSTFFGTTPGSQLIYNVATDQTTNPPTLSGFVQPPVPFHQMNCGNLIFSQDGQSGLVMFSGGHTLIGTLDGHSAPTWSLIDGADGAIGDSFSVDVTLPNNADTASTDLITTRYYESGHGFPLHYSVADIPYPGNRDFLYAICDISGSSEWLDAEGFKQIQLEAANDPPVGSGIKPIGQKFGYKIPAMVGSGMSAYANPVDQFNPVGFDIVTASTAALPRFFLVPGWSNTPNYAPVINGIIDFLFSVDGYVSPIPTVKFNRLNAADSLNVNSEPNWWMSAVILAQFACASDGLCGEIFLPDADGFCPCDYCADFTINVDHLQFGTLTARTDGTHGEITVDVGSVVPADMAELDLYYPDGLGGINSAADNINCSVDPVAGNVITITLGGGNPLPTLGSRIAFADQANTQAAEVNFAVALGPVSNPLQAELTAKFGSAADTPSTFIGQLDTLGPALSGPWQGMNCTGGVDSYLAGILGATDDGGPAQYGNSLAFNGGNPLSGLADFSGSQVFLFCSRDIDGSIIYTCGPVPADDTCFKPCANCASNLFCAFDGIPVGAAAPGINGCGTDNGGCNIPSACVQFAGKPPRSVILDYSFTRNDCDTESGCPSTCTCPDGSIELFHSGGGTGTGWCGYFVDVPSSMPDCTFDCGDGPQPVTNRDMGAEFSWQAYALDAITGQFECGMLALINQHDFFGSSPGSPGCPSCAVLDGCFYFSSWGDAGYTKDSLPIRASDILGRFFTLYRITAGPSDICQSIPHQGNIANFGDTVADGGVCTYEDTITVRAA